MGRKKSDSSSVIVLAVVLLAGGAYAYDSSQKDKIADGVTIAGVDVGGLDADQAAAAVRRQPAGAAAPLAPGHLRRRDLDAAGREAEGPAPMSTAPSSRRSRRARTAACRPGWSATSAAAKSTSRSPAELSYSQPAINRFVRHVAAEVNREPEDASVNPSGDSLEVVAGKDGRKLRDDLLTEELENAVLNADGPHTRRRQGPLDPAGGDDQGRRLRSTRPT